MFKEMFDENIKQKNVSFLQKSLEYAYYMSLGKKISVDDLNYIYTTHRLISVFYDYFKNDIDINLMYHRSLEIFVRCLVKTKN